ncbi:MAG: hypothetical protein UX15_C0012G0019 [Parcubacteria group bacterium GW2011_GWA1_45_7]|nr:MAG: hypothetical protein UX15_C0012G0019 [Parcubacteria group bacterium GW2011_GWA1_45_7]
MSKLKTITAITGLILIAMSPGVICQATTTASTSGLFPNPSKIGTILCHDDFFGETRKIPTRNHYYYLRGNRIRCCPFEQGCRVHYQKHIRGITIG